MPSKQCLDLCLTKQLGTIALLLLTHKINSHVTESFTHTHTHTHNHTTVISSKKTIKKHICYLTPILGKEF